MSRRRSCLEYAFGAVAFFVIMAVALFSLASGISHRKMERAASTLKKPEMLQRYTETIAREQVKTAEPEPKSSLSLPSRERASSDTLVCWDQLLKRWDRFKANKGEGSWHSVQALLGMDEGACDASDGKKTPSQLSPEEWAQVEACLAREQDLVNEILDTARVGGPVYPIDLTKWPPEDLPHHGLLRQMCCFLVWDAAVKTRAGNLGGALESLNGCMRIGDALREEPLLWSQFTAAMPVVHGVSWALREGFEPGQVPPELFRPMLNELALAQRRDVFADAMRAEAFIRLRHLATSRNGKDKVRGIRDMNGATAAAEQSPVGRAILRIYAGPLGKPWFDSDMATFATTMDRLAAAAERPYYRAEPLLTSLGEEQLTESVSHPLAPFLLGGYVETFQLQGAIEVAADLTRIGLLIEHHRAQRGEFPQTLDELAPNLGGTVPLDPFSGQPYRYILGDGSFLLYSVGKNQRDDAGRSDWRDGDLVWRAN